MGYHASIINCPQCQPDVVETYSYDDGNYTFGSFHCGDCEAKYEVVKKFEGESYFSEAVDRVQCQYDIWNSITYNLTRCGTSPKMSCGDDGCQPNGCQDYSCLSLRSKQYFPNLEIFNY